MHHGAGAASNTGAGRLLAVGGEEAGGSAASAPAAAEGSRGGAAATKPCGKETGEQQRGLTEVDRSRAARARGKPPQAEAEQAGPLSTSDDLPMRGGDPPDEEGTHTCVGQREARLSQHRQPVLRLALVRPGIALPFRTETRRRESPREC